MEAWRTISINEACKVEYGTRVVQKRDGGSVYPVYGGGGATFFMDIANRFNRVVISRFGMSEECTRYVAGEFFLNDSGLTLSPRDPEALLPEFLDRVALALNDEIFALGKGAAQKNLDVPAFRELRIAYPVSLVEQRRIVEILDESFEAIASAKANAEKNLLNARTVFESYLQDAYTVRVGHLPRERLEALCEKNRLITYGVIKLGDPIEDGVPCLRTSNVRWLDIDTTGMKRIAPTLAAEYSRTILRGGEVLVNVRGTLGGVAVVPDHMAGWNVSREVAVAPVNADVLDPEYAAFWIGSRTSQDWLSGVKKGAAYTGINIEDLRNLPVPLPGLEAQRAIVDDVVAVRDAARRMEEVYERKIAALDELRKSLLHLAFTGALTAKSTDKQVAEVA